MIAGDHSDTIDGIISFFDCTIGGSWAVTFSAVAHPEALIFENCRSVSDEVDPTPESSK